MTRALREEPPAVVDDPPVARDHRQEPDVVQSALGLAPEIILVGVLGLVLSYSALHLDNTDTWFHLTLGHHFGSDWSLAHPGSLTPFASSDWVATQWSTEMLASQFETWFGLPGVAWLFGALYLCLILTTYVVCRRRGTALPAAVITTMVVFGSATALSARPQVVSLILLAVTVHAWLKTWDDGRIRWWLIALTWVWATAHGLWSAGVLVGFVACAGLVLDRRFRGRRAGVSFAVPLLSLLAAALTPVGPRLLTSQFAVSDRSSLIPEWGPTSFRTFSALVVAAMLAWVAVLWARRGGTAWTPLLLLLLAGGWMLLVTRMVPLAAVTLAPLLATAIAQSTPSRPGSRTEQRVERGVLGLAAVGYLVVLALLVPHTASSPSGVPNRLEGRLSSLPNGTTVLVDDGIGAWMEWAVPDVDPIIDGMLDAYPVNYLRRFFDFRELKPGWQNFVRDSGARVAVVRRDAPVAGALQDQLGWRVVQRDRDWVYLEAGSAQS